MILTYVNKPGFELIVCGSPSQDWLDWVRTTAVPLTPGQAAWRFAVDDKEPGKVSDGD